MNQSESLAQKLSDYFRQAFGSDLIVNRNDMQTIPLHTGQAPDKTAFTIANQDEYYNQVTKLPKLQEQGDGMRSFASILLDTFTSEHSITLIDEPEAFLHPPQARLLGSAGLFVVPVGEMECFDKTVNKEKKDWVYHVLENYDLATEAKLEEARKFVQVIVDYKPL